MPRGAVHRAGVGRRRTGRWGATAASLVLAAAPAGRTTIGVYHGWGAFRDADPPRCFAITRAVAAGGAAAGRAGEAQGGGFAAVATVPGGGLAASFYLRLSRPVARPARVTLSVGERRFVLAAAGRDALAGDGASDRAIVDAMRSGRSMSVEGVAAGGAPFADVYALAGAATAIDAATLACVGR